MVSDCPSLTLVMPEVSSCYKEVLPTHCCQGLSHKGSSNRVVLAVKIAYNVKHSEMTVCVALWKLN